VLHASPADPQTPSPAPARSSTSRTGSWSGWLRRILGGALAAPPSTVCSRRDHAPIGADLGGSGAALQLVVAGYTIVYAVLLITGTRLGRRFGHRRLFLAGLALFTVASLACGLAATTLVSADDEVVARFRPMTTSDDPQAIAAIKAQPAD
jgi:MFS family permease